ncbi:MAG: YqgE/AlgH family protein [Pantoea sp. Brub]|nr:YqgE/AlgH family protein [Pantoea sp. Brub]
MNLKHHFLIAMPSLKDPFFRRSVIYICEHNDEGAMGLIINKPMENITVEDILKKLKIFTENRDTTIKLNKPVFIGGPLAEDRGFILHSAQRVFNTSIHISDNTIITTSRDVLESIGSSSQPTNILVALGYCAWEKNQLENELIDNTWLTTPANSKVIFQIPISERWRVAALSIGVNIYTIANNIGHA